MINGHVRRPAAPRDLGAVEAAGVGALLAQPAQQRARMLPVDADPGVQLAVVEGVEC
jgi:hypothetical protein